MYKVIGGDKQEYGPVTADEVRHWIADGRLSAESLAQSAESGSWRPLGAFPEFVDALRAQAQQFPHAVPPVQSPARQDYPVDVVSATPRVDIGSCFARSGKLLLENFGLIFAAVFLVWMIGLVCQFLPFAGFLYWVVRGALLGGLFLIFLRRIRGQPAAVGDVFAAFSFAFAQLMLASLVTSLLSWIGLFFCLLPGIYLMVAWAFSLPLVADKNMEFWSAMELSRRVVSRVWFQMFLLLVLAFLPYLVTMLFAQVKISTAMYHVMQQAMGGGQPDFNKLMEMAMKIARDSLPLVMVSKLVLLVNMPLAIGALLYAYEDIFGSRPAPKA